MPLSRLQPTVLWHHFAELCARPRVSKHEQAVVDYLRQVAETHSLGFRIDRAGNVILSRPASVGREQAPGVVLQSHIDMVPQKRADVAHDFLRDPICPVVDGEWVRAQGTTLGADNGIGAAAMLAVVTASDLSHGPLEALFTVDEEAGMGGAKGLEPGILTGSLLLNLDTEEEGELYVGCAGGADVTARWPIVRHALPAGWVARRVTVSGLKGGHSGIDIHRGRANAAKLLARLLVAARGQWSLAVASMQAGTMRNAIPRDAEAVVLLPREHAAAFDAFIGTTQQTWQDEYRATDPALCLAVSAAPTPEAMWSIALTAAVIHAVNACPSTALRSSPAFSGVIETSVNVGVIRERDGQLEMLCMPRSLRETARDELLAQLASLFTLAGAEVQIDNRYPGWTPAANSPLLARMQDIHQQVFGAPAHVQVIHAGLECGMLGAAYPQWDMISFGPTIRGAHSPDEAVNVASVEGFWRYLVAALDGLSRE